MAYITERLVKLCKIYCDIWLGLHEACVRGGRTLRHNQIFSMDSLPNFVTHGALLRVLCAGESSAKKNTQKIKLLSKYENSS